MMSDFGGSGAVHTVLNGVAFGGHVTPRGSDMNWFDQSYTIHLSQKMHASEGLLSGGEVVSECARSLLLGVRGLGCRVYGSVGYMFQGSGLTDHKRVKGVGCRG